MDEIVLVFVFALLGGLLFPEAKKKPKSSWEEFKDGLFSPLGISAGLLVVIVAILFYQAV